MCTQVSGAIYPKMVKYHENGDSGPQITHFHENGCFWVKWGLSGPKGAPGAKKATKPLRNVWFNSTLSEGTPPGPF